MDFHHQVIAHAERTKSEHFLRLYQENARINLFKNLTKQLYVRHLKHKKHIPLLFLQFAHLFDDSQKVITFLSSEAHFLLTIFTRQQISDHRMN